MLLPVDQPQTRLLAVRAKIITKGKKNKLGLSRAKLKKKQGLRFPFVALNGLSKKKKSNQLGYHKPTSSTTELKKPNPITTLYQPKPYQQYP